MQVFGLIGSPVSHSLSPPLHEAAYDELEMDARYVAFEPDRKNLETAIEGARALGIRGLNVTIPFKRDVLDLCEPDELARRIGAVNTLDFGGGSVTGHNTDAVGVRRALAHHGVSPSGRAVVVGAGGAGRAAAFALAEEGMNIEVANRTVESAHDLAGEIDGATGHGLDALDGLLSDADVLINATSVGMESNETPVPPAALHSGLAVLDAVYSPVETRLLRAADSVGATTVDGGWMLLYQGVAAFERWTGHTAPVDAMNAALRARI
jgi:shikimate dehydrogenase